jgi:hypothetical protein
VVAAAQIDAVGGENRSVLSGLRAGPEPAKERSSISAVLRAKVVSERTAKLGLYWCEGRECPAAPDGKPAWFGEVGTELEELTIVGITL